MLRMHKSVKRAPRKDRPFERAAVRGVEAADGAVGKIELDEGLATAVDVHEDGTEGGDTGDLGCTRDSELNVGDGVAHGGRRTCLH